MSSKFDQIKYTLFPFLNWLPMLDAQTLRIDVVAGITAGVLILPQAIALATVAGLPPEYGLYTSIFPVIIAALWGSSHHSLSGPNTALAVLTAMTIAPFANIGTPDFIQYAITLTFMTGIIQLLLGVFRMGVIFNYFSHTTMIALVTGVGIIIVMQQVGNFIGVVMNPNEDMDEVIQQIFIMLPQSNVYAVITGVATVVSGLVIKKLRPSWPHYIIAVIIGMITAQILNIFFGSATTQIDMIGYMELSLTPFSAPDFSPQNFSEFSVIAYPSAVSMAILALMQSSVIARSMAAKSGQQGVNINQETVGQGLSNVAGSFLSCFPSCGSFNRSAANIESGARTPLAGIISAIALLALIFVAAPIVAYLPIPVMAGVLFLVGAALVKIDDMKKLMLTPGLNRWIFISVLGTTVFAGVDTGVYLGVFLSIVAYFRGVSRPEVERVFDEEAEPYLAKNMNINDTTTIRVAGNLFFGSSEALEKELADLSTLDQRKAHLVIVGEQILNIDSSASEAIANEAKKRAKNGFKTAIWLRSNTLQKNVDDNSLIDALGAEYVHCDGVPITQHPEPRMREAKASA